MSRRSKQRAGKPGARSWKTVAGVVLGVAVLGVLIGYVSLRVYLHGEGFRKFLSEKVSRSAGVKGEFGAFEWSGLSVATEGFHAEGNGRLRKLDADRLHMEVGLGGVGRGVWILKSTVLDRLELELDPKAETGRKKEREAKEDTPAVKRAKRSPWLPDEVELADLDFRQVTVRTLTTSGMVAAENVRLRARQAPGTKSFSVDLSGGRFSLPMKHVPVLHLDEAKLRIQPDMAFLAHAGLRAEGGGRVDAQGEWEKASKRVEVDGNLSGFRLENLLDENWARRLQGDVSSSFRLRADRDAELSSEGDLVVKNGVLTALPVLDVLAAYADTRRFRSLPLSEARAHWEWKKGELRLSGLVLESEGLIALEGSLAVKDRKMEGEFQLGLAPGILAGLPGAERNVFSPGARGLWWTPVRVSGSVDDPKEDLSDRLIVAAGVRLFEFLPDGGAKVLKYGGDVLGETPEEAIERSRKLIKEGEKTVREAKGILKDLLGK
ncbi:MAG: hypothetical protein QM627_09550 [Luteolibacter sp.]